MGWQQTAAKAALVFLRPILMTIVVEFVGGLFAAARNHFDGRPNPEAKHNVESYMSASELGAVQEVLTLLQNRTLEHVEEAIETGKIPDFDLSDPGGTVA